jgi:tetratricopeptide (TPR) repeat protein
MKYILINLICGILCVSASLCYADQKGEKEVKLALKMAESSPASNAVHRLELAAEQYPYHPANFEVLFQLGCRYMENAQLEKADTTFNILLKRYGKYADSNPRIDESVIAKAKILAAQKTPDDGITALRTFLKKRRKSKARAQALYELAGLYCEKKEYDKAEKCLQPIAKSETSRYKEDAEQFLAEIEKLKTANKVTKEEKKKYWLQNSCYNRLYKCWQIPTTKRTD